MASAAGFALAAATGITPAHADQYRMAADNAQVDCTISARDLTRISLVGDAFASVSKISTGAAATDFTVTNEPVRGDIYLSVPDGFTAGRLSFFATSRKGYVYKFACDVSGEDAEQIFVSNPALADERALAWKGRASPSDAAVRLVQSMAGDIVPDGFQVRQVAGAARSVGPLGVRLIAEYRGADLLGSVLRIDNWSGETIPLDVAQFAPASSLAASASATAVPPHGAVTAYVVRDLRVGS